MFPEAPPGWLILQQRAQQAKTTQELSRIIDEMNRLLSQYEAVSHRRQSDRPRSESSAKIRVRQESGRA